MENVAQLEKNGKSPRRLKRLKKKKEDKKKAEGTYRKGKFRGK